MKTYLKQFSGKCTARIVCCSTRVCLKIAFRQMRVTVCGRFGSNEGGAAGYVDGMRAKYTAKWGVYLAGMNFQTCSSTGTRQTVQKFSS